MTYDGGRMEEGWKMRYVLYRLVIAVSLSLAVVPILKAEEDNKSLALYFDGSENYVDCGNDESLQLTGSFTIEAWFNPAVWNDGQTGNKMIASKYNYDRGNDSGWSLGRAFGAMDGLSFIVCDGENKAVNWNAGDIEKLKGTWIYAAGVFKAGEYIKLYINGDEIQTRRTALASFADASEQNFTIGKRSDADVYFTGLIDEVRLYNRALSAEEIQNNYTGTMPITKEGLVSWWKLDGDTEGIIPDELGRNNGTIDGVSSWRPGRAEKGN